MNKVRDSIKRTWVWLRNKFLFKIDKEQWKEILPSLSVSNHENTILGAILVSLLIAALLIRSYLLGVSLPTKILEFVTLGLCQATLLVSVLTKPENYGFIRVTVYVFIAITLIYSSVLGTYCSPDKIAATFGAIIIAAPLLFTDKPWVMNLSTIFHVAFFVTLALLFDGKDYASGDSVNAVAFGIISIIVGSYLNSVKLKRYVSEAALKRLSNTDLLTSLNNRNSYEQNLPSYRARCKKSLHCIYLDANNLHEINNNKGHAAGDELLQEIASALRKQFGQKDTYRIGGDEFVALVVDGSKEEVEKKLEDFMKEISEKGYDVSIGESFASVGDGADIRSLINKAEADMYVAKRAYYLTHGSELRNSTSD